MTEVFSASSGAHHSVIGTLENQVKIAEIRAQDMSTEMNELVVANNQLKTQLALPRPSGSQGMDETRINELRDELTSERNSKLKTWADHETKIWKRVNRDCGNVAYEDFLEQVAVPDPNKLNEIFAHTRMTAEKAGDMIEFWLGALDIAPMAWGRPLGECQDPPAQ